MSPPDHAHDHSHTIPPGPGELRAKGRRLTRQRQLIWEALTAEPEHHLSAEQLVERVGAELPRVNASTVYRTLELLVAEGLLLRTDLGGDRAFYEPAREHAHHHLVCDHCGSIHHFHDQLLGDLPDRIEAASGYRIGGREISLHGLCANCKAPKRAVRHR